MYTWVVATLLAWFCLLPAAALPEKYRAQVIGVTDGDTIKVLHAGKSETLRLAQIDCPEKDQDYGRVAKQTTSKLVFQKTVLVAPIGRDRYGRTIAEVQLEDGKSLNSELVQQGYAWQFTKYSSDQALHALEEEAKANHRGLWQAPNPLPPWEFRKHPRNTKEPVSFSEDDVTRFQ